MKCSNTCETTCKTTCESDAWAYRHAHWYLEDVHVHTLIAAGMGQVMCSIRANLVAFYLEIPLEDKYNYVGQWYQLGQTVETLCVCRGEGKMYTHASGKEQDGISFMHGFT